MTREMDGKENQDQDGGQPQGDPPNPVLEWAEAQQLRNQGQQQQQQHEQPPHEQPPQEQRGQQPPPPQQHQAPLPLRLNTVNQGFGNPGHAGMRPNTTGFPGSAGTNLPQRPMPTMFAPREHPNYSYNAIPPQAFAPSPFGPAHLPPPPRFMYNGGAFPNFPPPGQPPAYRPMLPASAGNQGIRQGAGAARPPAQEPQAQGSRQPHDAAPRNEAANAPARAQQAGGEQPSKKRPAGGKPDGKQPASKKHVGRGTAGEATAGAGEQRLSISERLDRGLITDVAGLTRQEENELLLWARRQKPEIPWADIKKNFKFIRAESTLRGRHRDLTHGKKPPKSAVYSERDDELLIEAIERMAGGPVDDVDKLNRNVYAPWVSASKYIRSHGGTTTAGPGKLKLRYIQLTQGEAAARSYQMKNKAKNKGKGGDAQGSQEQEPTEEPSARNNAANPADAQGLRWNHNEYAQYDVEMEEGVDFGEQAEVNKEEEEEAEEESEPEWDHDEYDDDVDWEEDADFS